MPPEAREETTHLALNTIKARPDFLAVRGGVRASVPAFLLETKPRRADRNPDSGPRFGFTVTKKLGNAVTRNRIRRRLKAAITAAALDTALQGFDYVVVARAVAVDRPFADLLDDVRRAMKAVHKPQGGPQRGKPSERQQRLDKQPAEVKKPASHGPA